MSKLTDKTVRKLFDDYWKNKAPGERHNALQRWSDPEFRKTILCEMPDHNDSIFQTRCWLWDLMYELGETEYCEGKGKPFAASFFGNHQHIRLKCNKCNCVWSSKSELKKEEDRHQKQDGRRTTKYDPGTKICDDGFPYIDSLSDNGEGYSIAFVPNSSVSIEPKLQVSFSYDNDKQGKQIHELLQQIAVIAQKRWSTVVDS